MLGGEGGDVGGGRMLGRGGGADLPRLEFPSVLSQSPHLNACQSLGHVRPEI